MRKEGIDKFVSKDSLLLLSNIVNLRKLRARRELNPRNFYGSQLFTFTRLFEILSFNLLIILLMTLVRHSGDHTKIHPRYVFAEWKPL